MKGSVRRGKSSPKKVKRHKKVNVERVNAGEICQAVNAKGTKLNKTRAFILYLDT
jgi:ribosomal protein L27